MSQATVAGVEVAVSALHARAFEIPLEEPESDGTAQWASTVMIVVEAHAGDETGFGYTYGSRACRTFVDELLAPAVVGRDAFAVAAAWEAMVAATRNAGSVGVASMAIAAVDLALWDLKARLLGLPLATLLDPARDEVPVYGSGGFTSLTDAQLEDQLGGWVEMGIPRVKMKVGRDPAADPHRVAIARTAIGPAPELMADANGALSRKAALAFAEDVLEPARVVWFEEPVSSDDLEGLRLLRDRLPAGIDVAAGEYGFAEFDFARLLGAGAVDCLQQTSPAAAASPASCVSPPSAPLRASTSRRTVRPRPTSIPAAPSPGFATSSTSTTTCGPRRCSSTAPARPNAAVCTPICPAPAPATT